MSNVSNLILQSLSGLLISALYLPVYFHTRKMDFLEKKDRKSIFVKFILCFCVNLLICTGRMNETQDFTDKAFHFLMMLIADTDLLIMKIPSEFLILLVLSTIKHIIHVFSPYNLLICLIQWIIWLLVRKKIKIGFYDTVLLLIFPLCLNTVRDVRIFNSIFLILYGISGLILKYIFRKSPETNIPLSPLIISAFKMVQLFN